ncbi:hypothetical protein Nepgr_009268 [Nepenthes gracilis]|uniref:Uncharacterized protein n=1 Tax=Nepenthes gracilis TaxID=150966 RepID=A0AAD3SAA9_NEPGR|nr:hypothetical protein Nepgr_009268 [Nepenthes gracilis]
MSKENVSSQTVNEMLTEMVRKSGLPCKRKSFSGQIAFINSRQRNVEKFKEKSKPACEGFGTQPYAVLLALRSPKLQLFPHLRQLRPENER